MRIKCVKANIHGVTGNCRIQLQITAKNHGAGRKFASIMKGATFHRTN